MGGEGLVANVVPAGKGATARLRPANDGSEAVPGRSTVGVAKPARTSRRCEAGCPTTKTG